MSDYVKRGIWTFLQAALGYASANLLTVNWAVDSKELKAALIGVLGSSIAGGLGALRNYINERNNL